MLVLHVVPCCNKWLQKLTPMLHLPMRHHCMSVTAACLQNYSVTLYVHSVVCQAAWSRLHCIPYSQSTMGAFLRPTCSSNCSRGRRQFLGIGQVPVSNFRVAYCFQVGFRNPTTVSVREPCSLHPVCIRKRRSVMFVLPLSYLN